jgi:hypothetical protein
MLGVKAKSWTFDIPLNTVIVFKGGAEQDRDGENWRYQWR